MNANKIFFAKIMLAFQRYFGARNCLVVHYKRRIKYNYDIWFV
jgi:hypothetical protein